jgi:hypothetical protein
VLVAGANLRVRGLGAWAGVPTRAAASSGVAPHPSSSFNESVLVNETARIFRSVVAGPDLERPTTGETPAMVAEAMASGTANPGVTKLKGAHHFRSRCR